MLGVPDLARTALAQLRNVASKYLVSIMVIIFYCAYMIFIQTPMYISEAKFILRSRTSSASAVGLGQILSMAGYARAYDEGYTLSEFILSKEAISAVDDKLGLRSQYGDSSIDIFSRFSFIYGSGNDDFVRYMRRNIKVLNDTQTGIVTLQVYAFDAKYAGEIVRTFLDLGDNFIRNLNAKANSDTIRLAQEEVASAEIRTSDARESIRIFRDSKDTLDPTKSSMMVSEVIQKLETELATTSSQISEIMKLGQNESPKLSGLKSKSEALKKQIATEKARLSGSSSTNTTQIREYEYLVQLQEFAAKQLSSAYASLENARIEAMRQNIYIVPVESPTIPDRSDYPKFFKSFFLVIFVVISMNIILWFSFSAKGENAYRFGDP